MKCTESKVACKEQRSSKPPKMEVLAEEIPAELQAHRRWVVWSWIWKGKKWDKPPKQPSGEPASSTDESTWCTFDEAMAALDSFDGIGFVLGDDTGIVGIDLDDCRDPQTGEISEPAASIIRELNTYAEVSPSGTGVKLLGHAKLPDKCRKVNHEAGIEIYEKGRYFTITGHRVPETPATINDRQHQVEWLIRTFIEKQQDNGHATACQHRNGQPNDEVATARSALAALRPSRADGYWDWLQVGMALHSVSNELFGDWDRWSKQSDKWSDGACAAKWRSFNGNGVGLGTLIHMAKEDGWQPTRPPTRTTATGAAKVGAPSSTSTIANCDNVDGDDGKADHATAEHVRHHRDRERDDQQLAASRGGRVVRPCWRRRGISCERNRHCSATTIRKPTCTGLVVHGTSPKRAVRRDATYRDRVRSRGNAATRTATAEALLHLRRHRSPATVTTCGNWSDRFAPATDIDRDLISGGVRHTWLGWACWDTSRVLYHQRPRTWCWQDDAGGNGRLGVERRPIVLASGRHRQDQDATTDTRCDDAPRGTAGQRQVAQVLLVGIRSHGHKHQYRRPPHVLRRRNATKYLDVVRHTQWGAASVRTWHSDRSSSSWTSRRGPVPGRMTPARIIEANRPAIIADVVGFLRSEAMTLQRFSRWSNWERDIVARLPEPSEAQSRHRGTAGGCRRRSRGSRDHRGLLRRQVAVVEVWRG